MPSAGNFCKQYGPYWDWQNVGPDEDPNSLMVFLEEFFENRCFWKKKIKSADSKKRHAKLHSRQRVFKLSFTFFGRSSDGYASPVCPSDKVVRPYPPSLIHNLKSNHVKPNNLNPGLVRSFIQRNSPAPKPTLKVCISQIIMINVLKFLTLLQKQSDLSLSCLSRP